MNSLLYVAYPLLPVSDESAGGAEQMLATLEREMAGRGYRTAVAACAGSTVAGEVIETGEASEELDHFEAREVEHNLRTIEEVSSRSTRGESFDLVHDKIRSMKSKGLTEAKFSPLGHFFGYEGRCAFPSNFDADYCYSLGYAAAQLVRADLTGYTVNVQNLTKSSDEWVAGGTPVTMMLNMEIRKGKPTPVIKKALVNLEDAPFKKFAENREAWAFGDEYVFPGPIQYFGPSEVCDATTVTLALEKGKCCKGCCCGK
jgi:6-phosphofructokinase